MLAGSARSPDLFFVQCVQSALISQRFYVGARLFGRLVCYQPLAHLTNPRNTSPSA